MVLQIHFQFSLAGELQAMQIHFQLKSLDRLGIMQSV